jgi:hypothetical protein
VVDHGADPADADQLVRSGHGAVDQEHEKSLLGPLRPHEWLK